MNFRGLFIGIDRYEDARVPWLSGAARDAQALYALCTDALGGTTELLTDEAATTTAIRNSLTNIGFDSRP